MFLDGAIKTYFYFFILCWCQAVAGIRMVSYRCDFGVAFYRYWNDWLPHESGRIHVELKKTYVIGNGSRYRANINSMAGSCRSIALITD